MTNARASQEDDRRHRMRSYLLAMGLRTLSFPVAVWAFLHDHLVLGWVFVVLAVAIPSFAVMIANAVDRRGQTGARPQSPVQGLGPAAPRADAVQEQAGRAAAPDGELVVGTVVTGPAEDPSPEPRPHP